MIKPLDLFTRATTIPAIVWSVSSALVNAGRRIVDDPFRTPFTQDMFDGFLNRIEHQWRTRWAGAFEPVEQGPPYSRAA